VTRLPNLLDRDAVPPELHEAYDRVASFRNGAVSGPYGILLHSPELAERAAALGQFVRWNSDLTPAQRETAIITAARHWDAELMWGSHVRLAREAGVRDEVITTVGSRTTLDALEDGEAAIVRYVRELLEANRVSAPTFEALQSIVGDTGIVDLTGLVGYYATVGFTLNAFEVPPPDGVEPLPA
jgi:4-carboxymuconolactone decarboxylase